MISDDESEMQPAIASTPSATSSHTPVSKQIGSLIHLSFPTQAQIANRTRSKLPLRDTPLPLLEGVWHGIGILK